VDEYGDLAQEFGAAEPGSLSRVGRRAVSPIRHGPPVLYLQGMDRSVDLRALLPLVRGLTILVVDDDEFVRDSTRLLLEDAGVHVLTARDGADALDQLAAHTPDLIFTDIGMPRMDGYQLVERIRRDPARARLTVIAVSALASPADRKRMRQAGFDAHLGKPFDYGSLRETFWFVMRRQRELYHRQRDRLRAFAEQVRRKARELRQASRFVLGTTPTLRGTGLPCRCGASAETLWRCADCARRCCPDCAFRLDGAFTCPTCADRRLAA
jgi:CheY-like chemotaxis protein